MADDTASVPDAHDFLFRRLTGGSGERVEGARAKIGGRPGRDAEVAALEETHPTRVGRHRKGELLLVHSEVQLEFLITS